MNFRIRSSEFMKYYSIDVYIQQTNAIVKIYEFAFAVRGSFI